MDTPSFPDLIRDHAGLIHKVAYAYCRSAADREDVRQEIVVQLWRAMDRYDGRCAITTWIYRIALNVAISCHRRERRHQIGRQPFDDELHALAEPTAAPTEDVQRLLACIDDLPPLDKALVLLYLDGHDHAATAEVLGLSVSNVGTRLHRLKDKLRVAFAQRPEPSKE